MIMKERNKHTRASVTLISAAIKKLQNRDHEISMELIEDNADTYELGVETGTIMFAKNCLRLIRTKLL